MKQHQFEELLFSGEKMNRQTHKEFKAFIKADPEAAALAKSWKALAANFTSPEVKKPKRGFSKRWMEIEAKDRRKREQFQAFWGILMSAFSALALAFYAAENSDSLISSATDVVFSSVSQLLEVNTFLQVLFRVFLTILDKFPPAWWASIAASIFLLPLLWLVVYRELVTVKGVQQ